MSNIILRSLILGLVAGIFMRIPIIVAHMLGSLISQLGSYSQIFGPGFLEDSTLVLGSVLSFFVMFALAALDYHLLLIDLLMSFPFECAQASSPSVLFNSFLKGEVRFILDTFFVLSQPFILISLLYYSCIGLINRAMPQFMSTFIGTPALQILMLLTLFAATDSIVRSVFSLVLLRDISFDL